MNKDQSGNVLAEYMRRIDDGESVNVDAICAEHPEIADELRSYVANEAMLADIVSKKETSQVNAQQETLKPGNSKETDKQLVGKMFGRYKLIRQLGQGAMGAVFLARDTNLERDVALKTPTISMHDREEFLERFKREAQAAAHLKHPNICPVHDFGEVDGVPYITMGLINGHPLSRLVIKENKDQRWIATIVRTIADALKHAHEQGVVHRDLKPGNILVEDNGVPYITDFGLACRVDQKDQSRLTQEGAILGTPSYMAPEQADGRTDDIGPTTDLYALGVILYELLSGETPFRGSLGSILAQITRDDPKPPEEINPHCDQELSRLALKMMAKAPSDRPASMDVVMAALDEFLASPKSETVVVDAKIQRNIDKLEATKKKIEGLVERGQYAQAIRLLEIMSAITAPEAVGFANWARAELPRVKAIPKQKRDSLPAIIATAKKMIKKHDYGQAAELLQQIPSNMRTDEVNDLLHQAIELQDEVDLLLTALRECVRRKQFKGIEENLKRLLEIKPGNRFAKELWESLQTYSKVPYKTRNYQFDKKGRLLPKEDGLGKAVIGAIAFGVVVFGLMLWGITIYLKSGNETLAVTVDEEMLKNGEITLTFDGKDYIINGPEFRLNIAPGEYGYEVRQGSTIIRNPETFTVVSDGRNVLEIGTISNTISAVSGKDPLLVKSVFNKIIPGTEIQKSLAFAPSGTDLFIDFKDNMMTGHRVQMISFTTDQKPEIYDFHSSDIDVSRDKSMVASARHAGVIELRDATTLSLTKQLQCSDKSGQFLVAHFSPDGKFVAGVTYADVLAIWDVKTGSKLTEFILESDEKWFGDLAFSPDSTMLFASAMGPTQRVVHRYDLAKKEETRHVISTIKGPGYIEALSNHRVILGSWDTGMSVVDLNLDKEEKTFGLPKHGTKFAVSPDQRIIACSNDKNSDIALHDAKNLEQVADLSFVHTTVKNLRFSDDGKYLAALGTLKNGGTDHVVIQVWQIGLSSPTQVNAATPIPTKANQKEFGPNLLSNGGFEEPRIDKDYQWIKWKSDLGGWTVGAKSVELCRKLHITSSEGDQFLDLNGSESGTIEQVIETNPDTEYLLSFRVSAYEEKPRRMRVLWNEEIVTELTAELDESASQPWTIEQVVVKASTNTSTLRFESLDSSFQGPLLDDISLRSMKALVGQDVPEEATFEALIEHLKSDTDSNHPLFNFARATYDEKMDFPALEFSASNAQVLQEEIEKAQNDAAEIEVKLSGPAKYFVDNPPPKKTLEDPNLSAAEQLTISRFLKKKIQFFRYNMMLANMKVSPKPFQNLDSKTWKLVPTVASAVTPESQKMEDRANELLQSVIDNHPNTPWALIAAQDLSRELGWKWVESNSKHEKVDELGERPSVTTPFTVTGSNPFTSDKLPAGARWVDKQGIAFRW